jgi:hypothetical protein
MDVTCHLTFAGYVIAGILTIVVAGFAAFSLLYWKFDLPYHGNTICYALLAMSLTLWAKPLSRARPKTGKTKKRRKRRRRTRDAGDSEPGRVFLGGLVGFGK